MLGARLDFYQQLNHEHDECVDFSVDSEKEIRGTGSGQETANYEMALSCFRLKSSKSKGEKEQRSANLLENGRRLLEEMIASCDGKCKQTIRTFSAKDLQEATNNFDPNRLLHDDGFDKLYKGMVGNCPVCVKKSMGGCSPRFVITDIVIGSQMSAHKNVWKLIGCCLESWVPMVVYQFAGDYFTLENYIFAISEDKGLQPLPWKSRVKIAMGTANAVAYLHTALLRPVVHCDIKPCNIMMDGGNNMIPKLLDFKLSVSIPEGETHVETDELIGTLGFVDPSYVQTNLITEKSDVYGFGVLLLMLLTAKKAFFKEDNQDPQLLAYYVVTCIENDRFKECLDPSIVAEESSSWLEKEMQICKFRELALKCVSEEPEDRPTMIEVGKELTHIYQSFLKVS